MFQYILLKIKLKQVLKLFSCKQKFLPSSPLKWHLVIVFSAKGDLQKVNLNLETVASNFDHGEQKQGLLYESVYSSQLIAPNKAG